MRRSSILIAALFLSPLAAPGSAAPSATEAVAGELLSADRAFSRAGEAKPLADSIAAMLDDDAMMPLPDGTFAKGKAAIVAALRANPANAAAKASWAPVGSGLSSDGTHGFTYGFMTMTEAGKPDRRAKYLAYWIKRPDGWRVAAYKRAPSGPGEVQAALRPEVPSTRAEPQSNAERIAGLKAAEKAFSDRAQQVGLGPAFVEFGSPHAMNMGRTADFTFGNTAIGDGMPQGPGSPLHWAADEAALVAPSGDLGVTFGYIRPNGPVEPGRPATIPFFTVWHRASPGAPWRYVAE